MEDKFIQGYVCAVCTLIKLQAGVGTECKELFLDGLGNRGLIHFERAGVDVADLKILKKYWKQLH